MSKVFPSVSKKDEMAYAKLETSLRKTRSHINTEGVEAKTEVANTSGGKTPVKLNSNSRK
jgi:hypothetical protein